MKHQCNQNHRSQFFQKDNVDLEESEGTSIKSKKKSPEAAQAANEEEKELKFEVQQRSPRAHSQSADHHDEVSKAQNQNSQQHSKGVKPRDQSQESQGFSLGQ